MTEIAVLFCVIATWHHESWTSNDPAMVT